MTFYTPADFVSDKKQSGYRYVAYKHADALPNGHGGGKPYVAEYKVRAVPQPADAFRGPRRATAIEAMQDLCDHLNGRKVAVPNLLKKAGHKAAPRQRIVRDPEVEAALGVLRDARAQRQGVQGYVYLIIEVHLGGALRYGKVGYSTNPRKRVAELQTGNPRILHLYAARPGTEEDEKRLHAKYTKDNVLQEWFEITKELLLEWDVEHIVKIPAAMQRAA